MTTPLTRRHFVAAASATAIAGVPTLLRAQTPISLRFSSSMVADQNAAHFAWAQRF